MRLLGVFEAIQPTKGDSMERSELYNGEVVLHFYGEDKRHDYVWNGDKLPSSTQITGILSKPGLRYWYVNQAIARIGDAIQPGRSYDEVALEKIFNKAKYGGADSRDDAASIGRLVHAWVEDYIAAKISGSKYTQKLPMHTGARRSVENFLEWDDKVDPEYVFCERRMISREHEFAGTVDIVAYINPFHLGLAKRADGDGKVPTIVDLKTGKRVYPEYWLQLASYAYMLHEEKPEEFAHDLSDMQRLIINISQAKGTISTPVAESDITVDAETFLALRKVYRWKEGK
jgi:hypothetical protein